MKSHSIIVKHLLNGRILSYQKKLPCQPKLKLRPCSTSLYVWVCVDIPFLLTAEMYWLLKRGLSVAAAGEAAEGE